MPEYLAPGVFLEEVDLKPPSIEAVSTSTTGMVGYTTRGPTIGRPVLVTNMLQFRQSFGRPLLTTNPAVLGKEELFLAAEGFFANGGRRLYVSRAVGAGAGKAASQTAGGMITRLSPGSDALIGQNIIKPATLRGLAQGKEIRLQMVEDGVTYNSNVLQVAAGGINRATGEVTLDNNITIAPAGKASFMAKSTSVITRINSLQNSQATEGTPLPDSILFSAADAGAWGNEIVVQAAHTDGARGEYDANLGANRIRLKSASGFYPKAFVEIDRGNGATAKLFRQVVSVSGNIVELDGAVLAANALNPVGGATSTIFTVCEFSLTVAYDALQESYRGLTLENVTGKFVTDVVNSRSRLIHIDTLPATTNPFFFPSGANGLSLTVTTPGVDAPPAAIDIIGQDLGPGKRSGLKSLEEVEDISIIAVPGWGEQAVQEALIEQCERLKYRVALLDPLVSGANPPNLNDIQAQRLQFDSKYAAIYYPRLIVRDAAGNRRAVGPSGHMAGLCARVDNERGVWKAPGNETVRNILDLEAIVTKGEHEVLNPQPNNINVFRDFRNEGRGLRIYGARCITSASDWKYLSVRRLFIFIERSLEIGTQWAVLEPNDQRLWSKLKDSVDSFLGGLWREGALFGEKKEDAYYINCGFDTMSLDDIDNGRLIMEIGLRPVKPAEFVIIRIGQWAGGSFTEEV
ncbi:MAG: phage tail sheath subtilisin-like domain-containing protein [Rhizobium sp.]|jgi:phage tail sheath protein FI|uniref:phage tail sheath subtilisin-like domain-containing protein n=1 Tax=Rhizobium sp. TaxID=391 RepID=UPI000690FAEE